MARDNAPEVIGAASVATLAYRLDSRQAQSPGYFSSCWTRNGTKGSAIDGRGTTVLKIPRFGGQPDYATLC
jgi:hypothetical protein